MNSLKVPQGTLISNVQSSGQQVVIPYPKRSDRKRVKVLLEINSRDRNTISYPQSSQFRWRLYRPLKDIIDIQIAGGTVPACLYNLNTGWNAFTFFEGTTRYNVTIPPGRYTYESLAANLASRLNSIPGITNNYAIEIDNITGYFTIKTLSGTSTFGFLFATGDFVDLYDQNHTLQMINSPAKLFGFRFNDYSDSGTGTITSPNVVDLDFLYTRIYLYINNDNTQDLNTIERSVGRQQPHAIIYFDQVKNNYKFLNKETFEPLYSAFPAPIARVNNLDISMRDEFDRIVDFNGRDFTILLEVTYLD